METKLKSGRVVAEHVDLSGSRFHDVNLAGAEFDDINMNRVRFHNINLSDISISAAQMGGATFKHVGLPDGSQGRQRPLRFEACDLAGTTFSNCDLSGVELTDCEIEGMKINGVPVDELLRAHGRPIR